MDTYLLLIYVTLEQERAIRSLYKRKGWDFKTTDLIASECTEAVSKLSDLSNSRTANEDTTKVEQAKVPKSVEAWSDFNLGKIFGATDNSQYRKQTAEKDCTAIMTRSALDMSVVEENKQNKHFLKNTLTKKTSAPTICSRKNTKLKDDNPLLYKTTPVFRIELPKKTKLETQLSMKDSRDLKMLDGLCGQIADTQNVDAAKGVENISEALGNGNNENGSPITTKLPLSGSKEENIPLSEACSKQGKLEEKMLTTTFKAEIREKNTSKKISLNQTKNTKVRKVLKGEYHCDECQVTFKYASAFNKHKKHGACVFVCSYCGKRYTARHYSNFQLHLKYHNNDKQHICAICGKAFAEKSKLTIHLRTHSNERPYVCDTCGRAFFTSMILRCHIKNIHRERPKQFCCELCGRKFVSVYNLNTHRNVTHSTERPYECTICHKTFKTKYALEKNHMKYHKQNDQLFYCNTCPKSFRKKEYLNHHLKRHMNERTHFCDKCGKGFYDNKTLCEHNRTHSGEKPYACTVCDYRCALKGNLSKHMKTHLSKENEESSSEDSFDLEKEYVAEKLGSHRADSYTENKEMCKSAVTHRLYFEGQESNAMDPVLSQRPIFYPDTYSILSLSSQEISNLRAQIGGSGVGNDYQSSQNNIVSSSNENSKTVKINLRPQNAVLMPEKESSRSEISGLIRYGSFDSASEEGNACPRLEPQIVSNYTQGGSLLVNAVCPFSLNESNR